MARIEDGIFTRAVVLETTNGSGTTTGDRDINEEYPINNETRKATNNDIQAGVIGADGTPVTTTDDDIYINDNHGIAAKLYTSGVGSNTGLATQFKLINGDVVEIELFEGTMIPLATIGCNRAGVLILR